MLIGKCYKALPYPNRAITTANYTVTEAPTRWFDRILVSAWQDEFKAIGDLSVRKQLSLKRGELLLRFAERYQQLKALSRRMRRSLQRQWRKSLAGIALLLLMGLHRRWRDHA